MKDTSFPPTQLPSTVAQVSLDMYFSVCLCIYSCLVADISATSRNVASTRTQQSITKMLLLISSVFVLLNLPRYVSNCSTA